MQVKTKTRRRPRQVPFHLIKKGGTFKSHGKTLIKVRPKVGMTDDGHIIHFADADLVTPS